jgi:hypothetical protein
LEIDLGMSLNRKDPYNTFSLLSNKRRGEEEEKEETCSKKTSFRRNSPHEVHIIQK